MIALPPLLLMVAAPDGYSYPGSSSEAAAYEKAWDDHAGKLRPSNSEAMQSIGWMAGRWSALVRDFPSASRSPDTAEVTGPADAQIDLTEGGRWMRISFVEPSRHARWTWFLGYDGIERRWVLHAIASPALLLQGPATAREWRNSRLTFEPQLENYAGFKSVIRQSILRTGEDGFRLVTEVRMPSGRFVAMDDVLFTRRR